MASFPPGSSVVFTQPWSAMILKPYRPPGLTLHSDAYDHVYVSTEVSSFMVVRAMTYFDINILFPVDLPLSIHHGPQCTVLPHLP